MISCLKSFVAIFCSSLSSGIILLQKSVECSYFSSLYSLGDQQTQEVVQIIFIYFPAVGVDSLFLPTVSNGSRVGRLSRLAERRAGDSFRRNSQGSLLLFWLSVGNAWSRVRDSRLALRWGFLSCVLT